MPRHCAGTYPIERRTVLTLAVASLAALGAAGCGERHTTSPATPGGGQAARTAAPAADVPALARAPRTPGTVVVSGLLTPEAHGPYTFHGRYRVRFAQRDPEHPAEAFAGQTAFVAYAAPAPDQAEGPGVVRLVRKAARGGTATVTLNGRLWVNASFGDFPYALRLEPLGR